MRRRLTIVVIAIAAALVAGVIAPTDPLWAASPDGADIRPTIRNTVPAHDDQAGVGTRLIPGQPQEVSLGPAALGAHSAYIRISVLEAGSDALIRVAGTPALSITSGRSGSTTILAPVTAGAATLLATSHVDVRVETIAAFTADGGTPGSTVALPQPTVRADTSVGLNTPSPVIGPLPIRVGVVGVGGVPAIDVRAAFVTVSADVSETGTLSVGGQPIPLQAGANLISTMVTPDGDGSIELSTSDPMARVNLTVRGYVAGSAENAPAASGPGAYWPISAGLTETFTLNDSTPRPLALTNSDTGSAYVVALAWATPSPALTVIDTADVSEGRSRGLIVDTEQGTLPQIIVLPARDALATVRRGNVEVTLVPIGVLLDTGRGAHRSLDISLTSPTATTVDATENYTSLFKGEITTAGAAPLNVLVTVDGEDVGFASLRPEPGGFGWSFALPFTRSGQRSVSFTVSDRAGGSATIEWNGYAIAPSSSDLVLNKDTVSMSDGPGFLAALRIDDKTITFAQDPGIEPGNVIVSGPAGAATEGYIRRVLGIDVTGGSWVVHTGPATLTDAFLQVSFRDERPLDENTIARLEEEPLPLGPGEVLYESSSRVVPPGESDLDPFLGEPIDVADVPEVLPSAMASRAPTSSRSTVEVGNSIEKSTTWGVSVFPNSPLSGSYKVTSSSEVSVVLKVTLNMTLEWPPFELPRGRIDEFSILGELTGKTTSSSEMSIAAQYKKDFTIARLRITFLPSTFMVGPVPVVVAGSLTFSIYAKIAVTGKAKLTITDSAQTVKTIGFRYANGRVEPVDEGPKATPKQTSFDGDGFSLTSLALVGAKQALAFKLYDLIGPSVEAGFGVGTDLAMSVTRGSGGRPVISGSIFVEGSVSLNLLITVPVIDYVLVDWEIAGASRRWNISQWQADLSSIFPNPGEFGPDPSEDPDDDPEEGDPTEPGEECPVEYVGEVVVCDGEQFAVAVETPAVTRIILGRDLAVGGGTDGTDGSIACGVGGTGDGVVVNHTLTIDVNGKSACAMGMEVAAGRVLTVLDSSPMKSGSLVSYAQDGTDAAGIRTTSAQLVVLSGNVAGTGDGAGAGIGGDGGGGGGVIVVRGGSLTGFGDTRNHSFDGGAGIGGGRGGRGSVLLVDDGYVSGFAGDGGAGIGGGAYAAGGSVTIRGGTVNGFGDRSEGGAGVGGGYRGSGGYALIDNGTLNGWGGDGAAGIGGGAQNYGIALQVHGGTVNGFGSAGARGGAGIGGGHLGSGSTVVVTAGIVYGFSQSGAGAGIGGGASGGGGSVVVRGGEVKGWGSGMGGAGIGGGAFGHGASLSVNGPATVAAYSSGGAAAIGGGRGGSSPSMTFTGGSVFANTSEGGAAIGGGSGGSAGSLVFTDADIQVFAGGGGDGSSGGAGIGGGAGASAAAITITGGSVQGDGDDGGAGIGGGRGGGSGPITISNAFVRGDSRSGGGAGIGSGSGGASSTITITDTDLEVRAGGGGAGIGSGAGGSVEAISVGGATGDISTFPTSTGPDAGAGIGSGADGVAQSITVSGGSVGIQAGVAIGAGARSVAGSITLSGVGSPYLVGGQGSAAIGAGSEAIVGDIVIDGGSFSAFAGGGGAGIGGGIRSVVGSISIDGTTIGNAVGGGGAAGIGSGPQGVAGPITIIDSMLTTVSGGGGASIGGGSAVDGPGITISASSVNAYLMHDPATAAGSGIGGGSGGNGGAITITGSVVSVVQSGGESAAIGGGAGGGDGGDVVIGLGAIVSVSTPSAAGAIGAGTGGMSFGSLELAGTLQLDGATLVLPAGIEVTVTGAITGVPVTDGTIESAAFITGEGTLNNQGLVTATIADTVIYLGPTYTVTFEPNHLDSVDTVATVTSYADTLLIGRRALPVPTPIDGWTFLGWNTASDGTGAEVTVDTVLSGLLSAYAIWEVV